MRRSVFSLMMILSFLMILSCTKKEIIVENDIEQCKLLEGTWSQTLLSDVALGNDASDLEYVVGFATYKTFKTINFDMNQNMQTKILNELVSYEPETEEGELSQEEIDLYFNQEMIIDAKFLVSEKYLQYENTQISINGSDFISYDEYMILNPQAEDKKHTLSWKIKDDKLILTVYFAEEKYETEYIRVSPVNN